MPRDLPSYRFGQELGDILVAALTRSIEDPAVRQKALRAIWEGIDEMRERRGETLLGDGLSLTDRLARKGSSTT